MLNPDLPRFKAQMVIIICIAILVIHIAVLYIICNV